MYELTKIQYDYINDNITDGILVVSKGEIKYANNSIYDLFNIKNKDIVNKKMYDIFPFTKENEAFFQIFLDSLVSKGESKGLVAYYDNDYRKYNFEITTKCFEKNPYTFISVIKKHEIKDDEIQNLNVPQKELNNNVLLSNNLLSSIKGTKKATIIFADVCGFTSLSETLNSKDLSKVMENFFHEILQITDKYNCHIIEILGDGILGVFGLDNNPNHADNAVACAIELQQRMKQINTWNIKHKFYEIEIGIGINTGIIKVSKIDTYNYSKYSIVGKDVNICARIQSYSVGKQIYISESTKEALHGKLLYNEVNKIFPKGITEPIQVYSVYGIDGIYKLKCEQDIDKAKVLKENIDIKFYYLKKKFLFFLEHTAKLIALSKDYVIFKTNADIELFENIMFDFKGKNYAKVVNIKNDTYTLRITYLSPDLKEYIQCLFL